MLSNDDNGSKLLITKEELLVQCAEVQERTKKMIAERFRQSRYITENVSFIDG